MYYVLILFVSILKSVSLIPLLYEMYATQITANIPMETLLMEAIITGLLLYIAAYKGEYLFTALFFVRFVVILMMIAFKFIQDQRWVWMYE